MMWISGALILLGLIVLVVAALMVLPHVAGLTKRLERLQRRKQQVEVLQTRVEELQTDVEALQEKLPTPDSLPQGRR
ncbi:hypothetical protein [Natronoglycomyces albus]|uniref:Uncharacterized protein n=1 Tax=Natronoglycomyces albus TaxID=2811108 RepID=A0A895XNP9_9ACTN|nr:hypothetical protein [Natronoglycomyces albus]QSB06757.1 hypothetical protein JQS30_07680 [Natronoglycomyces albus]